MAQVPFHLQFELNRRQRLIPHLSIWSAYMPIYGFLIGLLLATTIFRSRWCFVPIPILLWLTRGFYFGLLDVALWPMRHMDIIIGKNGLGYLAGKERWWVFLDGILWVKQIRPDVWTVLHHNGTVVNIPVSAITDEQVEHLREGVRRRVEYMKKLAH